MFGWTIIAISAKAHNLVAVIVWWLRGVYVAAGLFCVEASAVLTHTVDRTLTTSGRYIYTYCFHQ